MVIETEDEELKKVLRLITPLLDGALESIAIVDTTGVIIYANRSMKNLLGLKGKTIRGKPRFTSRVELTDCKGFDPLLEVIKTGETYQEDQTPAIINKEKKRVLIKALSLKDVDNSENIVGAIVTLRDDTGEILLSAKYQKVLKENEELRNKVERLQLKIEGLKETVYEVAKMERFKR